MIKDYILAGVFTTALTVFGCFVFIPVLRKVKLGQPILSYVEKHKLKGGTPTMGGLLIVIPAVLVFGLLSGFKGRLSLVSTIIGVSFMFVGFLDDLLKVKNKDNQGLTPYQKIIFQLVISLIAGIFVYKNGLTIAFIPFYKDYVDFGIFVIPLTSLVFIAITNSVNLTDGLDGLASGSVGAYLISIVTLILAEINTFLFLYYDVDEFYYLIMLSVCLLGGIFGFLLFNTNKASIFMGDTGSLSLGGFLGAISIFSSNVLFIPVIGVIFVFSSVSVIIQVIHFKRTGKRVFLMTPFHHHLELKGYSEAKISYVYSFVTGIMGIICIIFYL